DVYDNGRFLGNLYDDSRPDYDLANANATVAGVVFDGREKNKAFEEADGDQEKLRKLIQRQGKEQGEMVAQYRTRQPYQKSVDELLDSWKDSPFDEILITAAGALG